MEGKRIKKHPGKYLLIFLIVFLLCSESIAESIGTPTSESKPQGRLTIVPYPFYNDTIGFGAGAAVIMEGYYQRQITAVGSVLGSTEETAYAFFKVMNIQSPWVKRIFLDPTVFYGKVGTIDAYLDGNPAFPAERAGSNDSSEDNFIGTEGTDQAYQLVIKYLLPMGHGREHIIPDLELDDGILVSGQTGGGKWNPFKSGRTYVELTPFFRQQDFEKDNVVRIQRTANIEIALVHDNTDFKANPSKGSYQEIAFTRDWGALDSTAPWSVYTLELEKYFSLGATKRARQRVIALNFWTVDSPTWDESHTGSGGSTVFHRPPSYKGATLGGIWRLRGYPANRFHDRSAIYYAAEYRHIRSRNPLRKFTFKNRLDIDWVQYVAFAELGRVAPKWRLDDLHSDMRWSVGAGVRAMVNHIIVRLDYAFSDEASSGQLFIGQPF